MIICQSPNDSNDSQTIHRLSRLYIQLLAHFPAQLKQLLLFLLQRLIVEKRTMPSTQMLSKRIANRLTTTRFTNTMLYHLYLF